jgi:hypothetical protein
VDLPVVSSERNVPGNPAGYPLCDVAQYWTRYDLPGAPGTTWIYAHAQPGMFLPLLERTVATNGEGLLGKVVDLQLRDGRLLHYRITEVRQHAVNRRIAFAPPSQHRLILQTSEGPPGTVPKLQLAGRLISAEWTDERPPRPEPRACSQPARTDGGRPRRSAGPDATATPDPGTRVPADMDTGSLVLGTGAVLLGATLIAVVIARRRD